MEAPFALEYLNPGQRDPMEIRRKDVESYGLFRD
jgi:hypothetical protein